MRRRIIFMFIISKVAFIVLLITILVIPFPRTDSLVYGTAFSPDMAESLGLDWRETYTALLDDLGIKRFRFVARWETIEPLPGERNFVVLDELMDEAASRDVDVTLAIGEKLPRWPECHIPAWAESLPEENRRNAALEVLEDTVLRYHNHPALTRWQLENEPFLEFGICPERNPHIFLREAEEIIRRYDPNRPILVTESGELATWMRISGYGDMIGTTMYRTVYDNKQELYRSYDNLIPAAWYRMRARIVRILRGKEVIISELQAEPWSPGGEFFDHPTEELERSMNADRFYEVISFAKRTGLPEAYLWGSEYWYWLMNERKDDSMWEAARTLFKEDAQ